MRCPSCGEQNTESNAFCIFCGEALTPEQPAEEALGDEREADAALDELADEAADVGAHQEDYVLPALGRLGDLLADLFDEARRALERGDLADKVETAVGAVLDRGLRTRDIMDDETQVASTQEMGGAIVDMLR